MKGLFKRPSQEKRSKPWNPFAEVLVSAVSGAVEKGFCDAEGSTPCVTVCAPKGACQCGCEGIKKSLVDEINKRQLKISVGSMKVGCSGGCKNGPIIGFPLKGFFYVNVKGEDVAEIVEETLVNGRILFRLVSVNPDRSYRSDVYYEKSTGLLAAIDDKTCMVEVAKYFMDFEEGLSCGKCIPCRLGMLRMHEGMKRIMAGQGTEADLAEIELLCKTMITTPHCEFAMTSSRPVLSAVTYFKDEFKAHVAGQCASARACEQAAQQ